MDKPARIINILIGIWLFVSAFVWPHTAAQRTNAWIIGILVIGFAAWALAEPRVRFVNTVLAVWLFFYTLAVPRMSHATLWSNVLVAIAIFALSLIPSRPEPRLIEEPR